MKSSAQLDGNLPISAVRTMEALYEMRAVRIFRVLITVIWAVWGLMGLGLSIVGLYGLVAFAVSRRTREIGIRMAVGAERAAVLRLVLRQGLALALVGLAVGVMASVGAGELLQAAFPSGDDQGDIVGLLLVVPIVLAVTFLAAYVPARQASRVDPIRHSGTNERLDTATERCEIDLVLGSLQRLEKRDQRRLVRRGQREPERVSLHRARLDAVPLKPVGT